MNHESEWENSLRNRTDVAASLRDIASAVGWGILTAFAHIHNNHNMIIGSQEAVEAVEAVDNGRRAPLPSGAGRGRRS